MLFSRAFHLIFRAASLNIKRQIKLDIVGALIDHLPPKVARHPFCALSRGSGKSGPGKSGSDCSKIVQLSSYLINSLECSTNDKTKSWQNTARKYQQLIIHDRNRRLCYPPNRPTVHGRFVNRASEGAVFNICCQSIGLTLFSFLSNKEHTRTVVRALA
eukprot:sb/3472957/